MTRPWRHTIREGLAGLLFFLFLTGGQGMPVPTPEAGQIGSQVGKILSREHYRRQPLDDSISRQFLRMYLDALDYNHLFFLQSDIREFQEKYAALLDDRTLGGDVQPAFEIFGRRLQRVEQRVALVKDLLKEKFSFDMDESILKDRHEAPWPADEAEARRLWRQRVKFELLQERLNNKKPSETLNLVSRRYDRLLRSAREDDAETVLEIYLTSLALAYDPHSEYLPPVERDQFEVNMKLSLFGIGAVLRSEDGYATVSAIVPGGPADLDQRLKVNDRIAAVAQGDGEMVDVVDMKLRKAVELIRGPKGVAVRLQVIPANAPDPSARAEIRLIRDEISLPQQEAKAKLVERKNADGKLQRLGYIDLPLFYADMRGGPQSKSTTHDVARLIQELQSRRMDGLVLDLRRNGGGSLAEVIRLTGLFIGRGPIVQVKDAQGRIQIGKDDRASMVYDGELVVIVDRVSASASEIFAAALQDYGRAVIMGSRSTYGKGTVQRVEELTSNPSPGQERKTKGGVLKFTIQQFYRVSGRSTQSHGVAPDIQLPSLLDHPKIGEASLKNALPYDEVTPADYLPVNRVATHLGELRKRSSERVARDPEFGYLREEMDRLKTLLEEKTISLNEDQRLKDKKAETKREESRKKERKARKNGEFKTTEITLQQLEGGKPHAPAFTRKVMEEAATHMDDPPEVPDPTEPVSDPVFDEGLRILSDMIELSLKSGGNSTQH